MDILINKLTEEVLLTHISEFVGILTEEPYEYWEKDHFMANLPGKFELSVVASSGSGIAGYIIASLKDPGPYIHKFMVRKDLRNMMIGEKMLKYFENSLIESGYSQVKLTVREENTRAIRFYERNKFIIIGKRTDTKDNSTLIVMEKMI